MLQKRIIYFFLVFLSYNSTFGQCITGVDGYVNQNGGGSANLIVNSFPKYKGGISLESWTKLRLKYDCINGTGWKLQVAPDLPSTSIVSQDNPADFLDMETLTIRIVDIEVLSGPYTKPVLPFSVQLTSGYVDILNSIQKSGIDLIITISYDLGKVAGYSLLQKNPGLYQVNLRFNLMTIP